MGFGVRVYWVRHRRGSKLCFVPAAIPREAKPRTVEQRNFCLAVLNAVPTSPLGMFFNFRLYKTQEEIMNIILIKVLRF